MIKEVVMKTIMFLIMLSLTGCGALLLTSTVNRVRNKSSEELKSESLFSLCTAFGHYRDINHGKVANEIRRRKVFTASEYMSISKGYVHIGMSYDAVICAKGTPASINVSRGSGWSRTQFVYYGRGSECESCRLENQLSHSYHSCQYRCKPNYIYLEDGVVTSIQH